MKNTNSPSLLYTLFILLATLFIDPTHAWIDHISASEEVLQPGDQFTLTFHTSEYIQHNTQFYALFAFKSLSCPGLPVPSLPVPPVWDVAGEGGVDLYNAGFINTGKGVYDVTLRLPYSFPRMTTKCTLHAFVMEAVSKKKPASSMFQSSTLSDPWASFSDHSVFFSSSRMK